MRNMAMCQHCHSHGYIEQQRGGPAVCSHCGGVSEKYSVVRTEISFNTVEVHFSPMYEDFNAAGERLHTRGILGMLKMDCKHMPDGLRAEVEDWVRKAVEIQGVAR